MNLRNQLDFENGGAKVFLEDLNGGAKGFENGGAKSLLFQICLDLSDTESGKKIKNVEPWLLYQWLGKCGEV